MPQEELVLCTLVSGAISALLLSLRAGNAADYVYAALFLTCTSAVLKLRWLLGTLALAVPVVAAAAANLRVRWPSAAPGVCGTDAADVCAAAAGGGAWPELAAVGPLPLEALLHILVAWAVGALMAFVSGAAPTAACRLLLLPDCRTAAGAWRAGGARSAAAAR